MKRADIEAWFQVKRPIICVDRSLVPELAGLVRHVSIRKPAIVQVEFLWGNSDEGGPTYVARAADLDEAITSIERYLGRDAADWENMSASGFYPEVDHRPAADVHVVVEAMRAGILRVPDDLVFELKEAYWRSLRDAP